MSTSSLAAQRLEEAVWLSLQFAPWRGEFGQQSATVFRLPPLGQAGFPHLWLAREWGPAQNWQVGNFALQRGVVCPNLQQLWHWVETEAANIFSTLGGRENKRIWDPTASIWLRGTERTTEVVGLRARAAGFL